MQPPTDRQAKRFFFEGWMSSPRSQSPRDQKIKFANMYRIVCNFPPVGNSLFSSDVKIDSGRALIKGEERS